MSFRNRTALHLVAPVALAAWPVLFVAGSNPGEFGALDLVVALGLAAFTGIACAAVALAATGRPAPAALGGTVLVAGLYSPVLVHKLRDTSLLGIHAYGPLLPTLIALVVLLVLVRLRRAGDAVTPVLKPLSLAVATLVALAGFQSLRTVLRMREVQAATPPPPRAAADTTKPDIYVIVLDQYASTPVMRHILGIDNRAFEDSLRALGFRIPAASWTNYSFTAASVASMLEMNHVTHAKDVAAREGELTTLMPYNRMIAYNAAFDTARTHGYRIVFVPSPDFAGTRSSPGADRVLGPETGRERLTDHATSPLVIEVAKLSVIGKALAMGTVQLGSRWRQLAPFRGLELAVDEPSPKFVFGHTMVTHEPFVFSATCGRTQVVRRGFVDVYRDQVQCANLQVLRTVRRILASGRPSVIVLQGDHGPSVLEGRYLERPEDASAAQVAEQLGAFSAYRLPDGGVLADTITPVNVLRLVFNRHLGTRMPPVPNDAFYSTVEGKYEFAPVDLKAVTDFEHLSRERGSGIQ